MSTQIEQLSTLERRFTMSIPVAAIESETESRIKRLARTVKMSGFRPGKVPVKMVASTYGPQVRSEVLSDEVNKNFGAVVEQNQLRVAGYPRIEPKADAADAANFQFTATFEVFPEVQFADLGALAIERPIVEVSDEDVNRTIETLRKQRVRYEPKDGASVDGDRVIVDFAGEIDGVAFQGGSAKDFAMVLGERRMLPEFETAAHGLTKGETKTFELTFPADYFGKDVAGKTAKFVLTAKEVSAPVLPEVDSEFAKAFGVSGGSVDALKAEVRGNLELERKRRVFQSVRDQVFRGLRTQATLEIPKALVAAEADRMVQAAIEEMKSRGGKEADAQLSPSTFEPAATDRVAMGLIVGELVRANNLQATPQQVRALLNEQAQSYEKPEQVVAWYYQDERRLSEFEAVALEQNVVDFVLTKAKVSEKVVPFAELIGQAA
ncbi:MAG TPA: trigger factor [Casimicrobium huifangae]|jgi:trigger factor|uniref:trigger factor n=1 Tax=Casimicrobium huifangae TaxID=2591109 RepID=UPI0012EC599E|nr:trigger factor [Casimicrobium huifangae]HOB00780.1 trigger factor [Casimicrobium huifangae]HQA33517.1 trigger factor [Casimicrobium huifangae]HQD63921.1 trigger factor [Casimicrobium huifangae]